MTFHLSHYSQATVTPDGLYSITLHLHHPYSPHARIQVCFGLALVDPIQDTTPMMSMPNNPSNTVSVLVVCRVPDFQLTRWFSACVPVQLLVTVVAAAGNVLEQSTIIEQRTIGELIFNNNNSNMSFNMSQRQVESTEYLDQEQAAALALTGFKRDRQGSSSSSSSSSISSSTTKTHKHTKSMKVALEDDNLRQRNSQITPPMTPFIGGGDDDDCLVKTAFKNQQHASIRTANVSSMAKDWTDTEIQSGRRIVEIKVSLDPKLNMHNVNFKTSPDCRSSHSTLVSCIYYEEINDYVITSVDLVHLVTHIACDTAILNRQHPDSIKNRIRRCLEPLKPMVVDKYSTTRSFFDKIMGFGDPKPRKVEKTLKVFVWKMVEAAIHKTLLNFDKSSASTIKKEDTTNDLDLHFEEPVKIVSECDREQPIEQPIPQWMLAP